MFQVGCFRVAVLFRVDGDSRAAVLLRHLHLHGRHPGQGLERGAGPLPGVPGPRPLPVPRHGPGHLRQGRQVSHVTSRDVMNCVGFHVCLQKMASTTLQSFIVLLSLLFSV